jgi:hypothetical protein
VFSLNAGEDPTLLAPAPSDKNYVSLRMLADGSFVVGAEDGVYHLQTGDEPVAIFTPSCQPSAMNCFLGALVLADPVPEPADAQLGALVVLALLRRGRRA